MSTLEAALKTTSWDDISRALKTSYPRHINEHTEHTYKSVYEQLLTLTPVYNEIPFFIVFDTINEGDHAYVDVSGKEEHEDTSYSLSLTPWDEWLGYQLSNSLPTSDAIAHILWEMTFYGFTNEAVVKVGEDLAAQCSIENKVESLKNCIFCNGTKMIDERLCNLCDENGKMTIIS